MVQEASSAEKSPSDASISRAELPSPQLPDPHKHENSSFECSWTESEEKALVRNLLESGFIPGSLYTLSAWYKNSELSRRFGFFFLGNGIAQACGGLLAYGVLHMRGVAGLAGWQWLFILEGLFTIVSGVIFLSLFPGLPSNPVSLLRVSFFNEREKMIMLSRLRLDNDTRTARSRHIKGLHILSTRLKYLRSQIKDPKVLLHVLLTICGLAPTTALWSYAPTIIGSFGYGRLQANALVSVGQWISVCLIIIAAFVADKTGRRGFVVLFGVFCQWIFMVAFRALPDSSSAGLKFGIVTMGTATCSWWHSVNGSWLSINASCPEKRAIRMAMFIMAANCAGIVGGQLFRSDDLPYYHRGWTIIAVLMSIALSAVISLLISYWQANRYLASGGNVIDQSADEYGHHEHGLQRRSRSAASPYNY
ncbi:related to nicotinamide mononucleotide permease [Fusarium fujikuroi]|nr:related to nicotinamide mononucleotide permease [Fusarium fujikuroi]